MCVKNEVICGIAVDHLYLDRLAWSLRANSCKREVSEEREATDTEEGTKCGRVQKQRILKEGSE